MTVRSTRTTRPRHPDRPTTGRPSRACIRSTASLASLSPTPVRSRYRLIALIFCPASSSSLSSRAKASSPCAGEGKGDPLLDRLDRVLGLLQPCPGLFAESLDGPDLVPFREQGQDFLLEHRRCGKQFRRLAELRAAMLAIGDAGGIVLATERAADHVRRSWLGEKEESRVPCRGFRRKGCKLEFRSGQAPANEELDDQHRGQSDGMPRVQYDEFSSI